MFIARQILISALGLWLMSTTADAGAWPRKKGEGFASVSIRLGWPQDLDSWTSMQPTEDYSTLYLEYGLTDRLTLGLDIGHAVEGSGKTIVFAQWPIYQPENGPNVTAQLGLGRIAGQQVVRPGVSLGWGLEKGWFSIDSVAEAYLEDGKTDFKLDLTWGRNLGRDRKLVLQLQTGQPSGRDPFARFAPSLVVPVRDKIKLETGLTVGLTGDSSVGLKFGIWTDF